MSVMSRHKSLYEFYKVLATNGISAAYEDIPDVLLETHMITLSEHIGWMYTYCPQEIHVGQLDYWRRVIPRFRNEDLFVYVRQIMARTAMISGNDFEYVSLSVAMDEFEGVV